MAAESDEFCTFFERVVHAFDRLDTTKDAGLATAYLDFVTSCISRLDLKAVRQGILPLFGAALWNLVTPRRLEDHLAASSVAVRNRWKKSKGSLPSSSSMAESFWHSVFDWMFLAEASSQSVFVAGLELVKSSLHSPALRTFLVLVLEDINFVARCNLTARAQGWSLSWQVSQVHRAQLTGNLADGSDVERHMVARIRLLQRVVQRDFEESELDSLVYLTVSEAQRILVQEDLLRTVYAPRVETLCKLVRLIYEQPSKLVRALDAELTDPPAFNLEVVTVAHLPVQSFASVLESLAEPDAWFDLGDEVLTQDRLREVERLLASKVDREVLRLQYVSELALLQDHVGHLCDQARYALAYDVLHALDRLKPEAAADAHGGVRWQGWSRMALPADPVGSHGSAVHCFFGESPEPVRNEWAGLPLTKGLVLLVQLSVGGDTGTVVENVFPAVAKRFDSSTGNIALSYCTSKVPRPGSNGKGPFMLVRRNPANDLPRTLGTVLVQETAKEQNMSVLPPAFAPLLIGHGTGAQRTAAGPVRLFEMPPVDESGEVDEANEVDEAMVDKILEKDTATTGQSQRVLVLCQSERQLYKVVEEASLETLGRATRLKRRDVEAYNAQCLTRRLELLRQVEDLGAGLGVHGLTGITCETALHVFEVYVKPELERYKAAKEAESFPFAFFFNGRDDGKGNRREIGVVESMFEELESFRLFELVQDHEKRLNLIVQEHAQVLCATFRDVLDFVQDPASKRLRIHRVVLLQGGTLLERDALVVFLALERALVRQLFVFGDPIGESVRGKRAHTSLLDKLLRLGFHWEPKAPRPQVAASWTAVESRMTKFDPILARHLGSLRDAAEGNPGFVHKVQFVDVAEGEELDTTEPGEFQNLAEAEFVVAVYIFALALGYPSSSVSILTPFHAQKLLLIDVLHARCRHRQLPFPRVTCTFDEHAGQSNDVVLVSLARTRARDDFVLGDPYRMLTCLTAARQGLYIFGSKDLFQHDPLLKPILSATSATRLQLAFGQRYQQDPLPKPSATFAARSLADLGLLVAHLMQNKSRWIDSAQRNQ
ncbi:RNA helicase aquarius (Intron-binding protein of 160 kDa) [Durusdinium trenchii]|uniref:RNA helicase aquarius (Intron-binding protein of 160 kDa) n=1 Tax=Durusdinium trenchii TaxID=1381693 RepID=A0ABP0II66_9DINO